MTSSPQVVLPNKVFHQSLTSTYALGRTTPTQLISSPAYITPLVERGKGILELPLHLMLPTQPCFTVTSANGQPEESEGLPPNVVSMFWHHYDDDSFDPAVRENNTNEYSLFTFDIIKSLNERERHFLIHARLGHLPRTKKPTNDQKWHNGHRRLFWKIQRIV